MLQVRDITAKDLADLLLTGGYSPVFATVDIRDGKGMMSNYRGAALLAHPNGTFMLFQNGIWLPAIRQKLYEYEPKRRPGIITRFFGGS